MPVKSSTIAGMTTTGSHAPLVNFVISDDRQDDEGRRGADRADGRAHAPAALAPPCSWYRTMPSWLRVNEVNTPTA